jgi:hypothetical protein
MCWKHLQVIMAGPYESLLRESNWNSIISLKTESRAASCSVISEEAVLLLKGPQALPICHCVKSSFEGEVDSGVLGEMLLTGENRSTWRDACTQCRLVHHRHHMDWPGHKR